MTPELRYLLFTALLTGTLWIPVVIGYVRTRGFLRPVDYKVAPTSPLPDWVNRANRAHLNAVESFAPFATAVLIGRLANVSTSITTASAATFFFARAAHAVIHVSGWSRFFARTILFTAGWLAFVLLVIEILRHA